MPEEYKGSRHQSPARRLRNRDLCYFVVVGGTLSGLRDIPIFVSAFVDKSQKMVSL